MSDNFSKKKFFIILALLSTVGIFFIGRVASANIFAEMISGLLGIVVAALGSILILTIQALVAIASYQDFINSQAVILGWVIVRDICNMFFVVILMIIAFGTILHLENYNYKKWLPKLILMAILINFSKTICGLLIDVTQVVMLTFVNAFSTIGGANITSILGIDKILSLANSGKVTEWGVAASYFLGVIYLLVSIVVIITMMMMLVMRVVMIWIYVVLSPAAYLLSAFPGGEKYASQWWSEFIKNLIVGPVLAFFIWLSLAALSSGNATANIVSGAQNNQASTDNAALNLPTSNSSASTPSALISFVIAIGMLVGGLTISQQIGGAGGSLAGKGMGMLQKGQKIGMNGLGKGLGAVTGYNYASGVLKSYNSQRKTVKEEKYRLGAEKLAGGIGKAKQGLAYPLNKGGAWIKNNTPLGRYGVKAKAAAQEAKDTRKQAEDINYNYSHKNNTGHWQYNAAWDNWHHDQTGRTKTNDEMGDFVGQASSRLGDRAIRKENESKNFKNKQAKVDKYVKYGLMGGGLAASVVTGGLSGLAVGAAGTIGLNKLGKNIKHAGETDLNISSNWRLRQMTEAKDKMKMDSNEDITARMDDSSKSAIVRAAAAMEALDRGLLSVNDAENRKEEIKNTLSGQKENGDWKDKKVGSYVENMFNNKMPAASKTFEDLGSADPQKRSAAERTIKDRYEKGIYSLDLDTGTLTKSIGLLSRIMSSSEFTRQFKSLKDQSKKGAIVKALKDDGSDTSKEKLAFVKDLQFAYGNDQAGKEKALSNFSAEDLIDVFRKGTAVQQQAIKDTVVSSQRPNKIDIFTNAKNELSGTSTAMLDMRTKLGI